MSTYQQTMVLMSSLVFYITLTLVSIQSSMTTRKMLKHKSNLA